MKFIRKPTKHRVTYPIGVHYEESKAIAKLTARRIAKIFPQPINFLVRGSSGAIIATMVANHLNYPVRIFHIPKPEEQTHRDAFCRSFLDGPIIIIDDLMCTGQTILEIYKEFLFSNPKKPLSAIIICNKLNNNQKKIIRNSFLQFEPNLIILSS